MLVPGWQEATLRTIWEMRARQASLDLLFHNQNEVWFR